MAASNAKTFIIHLVPAGVNILSILVIYGAYAIYIKRRANPFPQGGFLFRLSFNEWYIDAIYNKFIVKPILSIKPCRILVRQAGHRRLYQFWQKQVLQYQN